MFDNREPHGMEFSVITYQPPLKDKKEKSSSSAIMAEREESRTKLMHT